MQVLIDKMEGLNGRVDTDKALRNREFGLLGNCSRIKTAQDIFVRFNMNSSSSHN